MATQRLPKNDGIMADCSLHPGNRFLSDELKMRASPPFCARKVKLPFEPIAKIAREKFIELLDGATRRHLIPMPHKPRITKLCVHLFQTLSLCSLDFLRYLLNPRWKSEKVSGRTDKKSSLQLLERKYSREEWLVAAS